MSEGGIETQEVPMNDGSGEIAKSNKGERFKNWLKEKFSKKYTGSGIPAQVVSNAATAESSPAVNIDKSESQLLPWSRKKVTPADVREAAAKIAEQVPAELEMYKRMSEQAEEMNRKRLRKAPPARQKTPTLVRRPAV